MKRYVNKNFPEISDEELLAGIKTDENPVFLKILYHRFYDLVLGSCLSVLKDLNAAEEAASVTFEIVITKAKDYEIKSLASWMHVIARNVCHNHFREKTRDRNIIQLRMAEVREPEIELEYFSRQRLAEREELEKTLMISLEKIDTLQAKCLKLFYFEKKSYAEICRELEIEMRSVKSCLQNGKRALHQVMKKYIEING